MKGKSTDLFELVRSLTPSEKRFFRLSASIQKGEKNYTKLFNAIEKQSRKPSGEPDEDALLKLFKKEKFVRHFSYEKNRLYHIIIKTLNEYHSESDIESSIQEMIQSAKIVFNKGLFLQCKKILSKAKELAYIHEFYRSIPLILRWEKALINRGFVYKDGVTIDTIFDEEKEALKKIENVSDYEKLNYKLIVTSSATGTRGQTAVQDLLKHPLLVDPNRALTPSAKSLYHNLLVGYWLMKGNYAEGYLHSRSLVELCEENKKTTEAGKYIAVLNNHMIFCNTLEKYDEIMYCIKKLRGISTSSQDLKERIFMFSYNQEISILYKAGSLKEAILLIPGIEKSLEEYSDGESKFLLCYNIIRIYILGADYQKALLWHIRMQQIMEKNLREDLKSSAQLLSLIIHYELGNDALLPYIIRSIYRSLKKKKDLYKIEILFIDFFKKLLRKIHSKKEIIVALSVLLKEMKRTVTDPHEEKIINEYFDYISWLESKIENKPFAEIVSNKVKQAQKN